MAGRLRLIETIPRGDHLLVENVAVAPHFQRMGLGRRLLAHAEHLAASLGHPQIRLYTNKRFVENVQFYLRLGYGIDREEPFRGGMTVYMSKLLPGKRSSSEERWIAVAAWSSPVQKLASFAIGHRRVDFLSSVRPLCRQPRRRFEGPTGAMATEFRQPFLLSCRARTWRSHLRNPLRSQSFRARLRVQRGANSGIRPPAGQAGGVGPLHHRRRHRDLRDAVHAAADRALLAALDLHGRRRVADRRRDLLFDAVAAGAGGRHARPHLRRRRAVDHAEPLHHGPYPQGRLRACRVGADGLVGARLDRRPDAWRPALREFRDRRRTWCLGPVLALPAHDVLVLPARRQPGYPARQRLAPSIRWSISDASSASHGSGSPG